MPEARHHGTVTQAMNIFDSNQLENHPLKRPLVLLALMLAIAFVFTTSMGGVGRDGNLVEQDFRYLAAAGHAWTRGLNPYVVAELDKASQDYFAPQGYEAELKYPLFYPPNIAALGVGLAMLPPRTSALTLAFVNILACLMLAVSALHLVYLSAREAAISPPTWMYAALAALIAGNPANSHSIWMGQTSLLATAFAAAGLMLVLCHRSRVLGPLGICLACIKPQIALGALVIGLRKTPYTLILAGMVVYLAMSLPTMTAHGILQPPLDWLNAIGGYRDHTYAESTFRHFFGLQSLLAALGLPHRWSPVIGIALLALLTVAAPRLMPVEVTALAIAIPTLFIQGHDYSLMAVFMLYACVPVQAANRPTLALAATCLVLVMCIPLRLVLSLGLPEIVGRYREIAALGLFGLTAIGAFRTWARSPSA